MTLDAFTEMAHRVVDEIPPVLCRGLSGGFLVVPQRMTDQGYLVLAHYVSEGSLGSRVVFYYGSFREMLAEEPPEVWEAELRETAWHEIRHHVENLAGVDDLGMEDDLQMEEWQRAAREASASPEAPSRKRRGFGMRRRWGR